MRRFSTYSKLVGLLGLSLSLVYCGQLEQIGALLDGGIADGGVTGDGGTVGQADAGKIDNSYDGGPKACPSAGCPYNETCDAVAKDCSCTLGGDCGSANQASWHYKLSCTGTGAGPADTQCVPVALATCAPGEAPSDDGTRCTCKVTATVDSCSTNVGAPKHCNGSTCGGVSAKCDTAFAANECGPGYTCYPIPQQGNYCLQICDHPDTVEECPAPQTLCTNFGIGAICFPPDACTDFWGGCQFGNTQGFCQPYWDSEAGAKTGVCIDPGTAPVGSHCNPFAQRADGEDARCEAGAQCLPMPDNSWRCIRSCDPSQSGGFGCPWGTECIDTCSPGQACRKGIVGFCI